MSRSLYEDCSEFLGNYVNVIHVPEIDTHPMSGLEFGSFSNIERNGSISKILDLKNKNFLAITSGLSVAQKTPNLEFLANEGYDEVYGARELGRIIQEKVKKPMAEELIFGTLSKGGHVEISLKNEKISFKFLSKETNKKELV